MSRNVLLALLMIALIAGLTLAGDDGLERYRQALDEFYAGRYQEAEAAFITIYRTRPDVCRDHTDEACEKHGGEHDFREHFHSDKELMAYAREFVARKDAARRRRSRAAKNAWKRRRAAAGTVSPARHGARRPS